MADKEDQGSGDSEPEKPLPFPVRYLALAVIVVQAVAFSTAAVVASGPGVTDSPLVWAAFGFLIAVGTSVSMYVVTKQPGNTLGRW